MAIPGPGKGWRQTKSSGMPRFVPRTRTSSFVAVSLQSSHGEGRAGDYL